MWSGKGGKWVTICCWYKITQNILIKTDCGSLQKWLDDRGNWILINELVCGWEGTLVKVMDKFEIC